MRCTASLLLALCAIPLIGQEKSALERDPSGWTELQPTADLKGWIRGRIPPDELSTQTQWKVEGPLLICEGDKGHEWLRFDKPFANFILHVEFRYPVVAGNPRYNSGIFVRTAADYSQWIQVQIGAGAGGYLFGIIPFDGRLQRFNLASQAPVQPVKPAGEWNVVEVTANGSTIASWVNGMTVNESKWINVPSGYFGLEAEGFRVEFRNLKIKTLPPTSVQ